METTTAANSVQPPIPEVILAAKISAAASRAASRLAHIGLVKAAVITGVFAFVTAVTTTYLQSRNQRPSITVVTQAPAQPAPVIEAAPARNWATPVHESILERPVSFPSSGVFYQVTDAPRGELPLRVDHSAGSRLECVLLNGQPVVVHDSVPGWFFENWEGVSACAWVRVTAKHSTGVFVTGWCNAKYLRSADTRDPLILRQSSFNAEKSKREREALLDAANRPPPPVFRRP